jgi:hypothetical protein
MNEEQLLAKCACEHCGNHIEFPIDSAGAAIDCPHCSQRTTLSLSAPAPRSDRPSSVELLAGFHGAIKRPAISIFYQAGLILVTVMMVLLPVVYVIRRSNGWFARVVYERDAWDVSLEEWAMDAEDWRVLLIANCARLAVGFSRLLLKLLMFLGHAMSCFLLR